MELIENLGVIVKVFTAIGFPIWAGVVLWAVVHISSLISKALKELRERNETLQTSLVAHMAEFDKRTSLIEQLLRRHDDDIETLLERERDDNTPQPRRRN